MNTLRETIEEYLSMRRALGFKLRAAGARLLEFVTFMEQQRASFITQELALRWAQQSSAVQPSTWAQRLSFVRNFARYRSATESAHADTAGGLTAVSYEAGSTLFLLGY